jgi:hypothetical protein
MWHYHADMAFYAKDAPCRGKFSAQRERQAGGPVTPQTTTTYGPLGV